MKKHLLIAALAFTAISSVSAQNDKAKASKSSPFTYVSADAKLTKYHTEDELKGLGKLELTQLYMERIKILTEVVPYLALQSKPGATLKEMGIPETPLNIEHVEKEVKNKGTYLSAVQNTLDDIIPYADKTNIIWSIMFFEEIIKKAEAGH